MRTPAVNDTASPHYAGFWIRFLAVWIDTLCLAILLYPVGMMFGGLDLSSLQATVDSSTYPTGGSMSSTMFSGTSAGDSAIQMLIYAAAILLFWKYRSATPGKMILGIAIADAETLQPPSMGQCVIRYLGYYLSCVFMLGFIWAAFDARKQGWHDKLAGTVVIYKK